MRAEVLTTLLLFWIYKIFWTVIQTTQRTSIDQYSFPLGQIDPQHHYSFYKTSKFRNFDFLENMEAFI